MNTFTKRGDISAETSNKSEAMEAVEHHFATAIKPIDPELYSMDPAERLEFSRAPSEGIGRFDTRNDAELKSVMFDHADQIERERAAWEFGDRHKQDAVQSVSEVAAHDPDRAVRWGALWLLQKIGDNRAADALAPFLADEDIEVRDWAQLLTREITGQEMPDRIERPTIYDPENPFDQTLPLTIAGYARTHVPGMGWVQATLSPQWFEAILGRVMACTCRDTFDKDLVIEKRMKSYHPDGSDHYEIYKFRGSTFNPAPDITHHVYECVSTHTFYPSGKVEDTSVAPIDDVNVILNRVATPLAVPVRMPVIPLAPPRPRQSAEPSRKEAPTRYVQSVRGRYMGAAFVNVERLLNQGMRIGPGEVQLSSLHHPIVGSMTNTHLFGTFKGKISDLSGDGLLDINTERCHGTVKGELDYALTGTPNPDPYDPYAMV